MTSSETDIVLRKVATLLEELGVSYFVGGSVASSAWGTPRFTQDIDIVARMTDATNVDAIVARLQDEFYLDGDLIRDAIASKGSFNLLYLETMTKADVFVPEETPWRVGEWERRRQKQTGDGDDAFSAWYASPEDLVLQKLLWYRMTNEQSERQWRDVQGVLRAQAEHLDIPYMQHWAGEIGVADLLIRALDDAGLV